MGDEVLCATTRFAAPWLLAGLGGRWRVENGQGIAEWTDAHGAEQRIAAPLDDWRWPGEPAALLRAASAEQGGLVYAQPDRQPSRVHELTQAILAPYAAEGGRVQLGGCTLDWKLAWLRVGDAADAAHHRSNSIELQWLDASGAPLEDPPDAKQLTRMASPPEASTAPPPIEALLLLPVWRCWVHGRVVAEIDEQSINVDVEGWGRELIDDAFEAPRFDIGCGVPSHRVVLDEDGDIGPDTAIVACTESGRRLLCSKMQRCGASDEWVLPRFAQNCPVTGMSVRTSKLQSCNMCQQPVAPQALNSGRCEVCHKLVPTTKEDARLARILGEFPRLDEWGSWRVGESRDYWVLTAGRFLRRLLIVVRKEPLELLRAATGVRWLPGWSDASDKLLAELQS